MTLQSAMKRISSLPCGFWHLLPPVLGALLHNLLSCSSFSHSLVGVGVKCLNVSGGDSLLKEQEWKALGAGLWECNEGKWRCAQCHIAVQHIDSRAHCICVHVLPLSLICITSGNLLNFSKPQFSHLINEDENTFSMNVLCGFNYVGDATHNTGCVADP